MAEFWFIRHFRTPWNAEGRLQGQRDIALEDPMGLEDAETLTSNLEALKGRDFALVLTSPLGRARQTAALHGFANAQPDDDMAEIAFGDWEGRTWRDLDAAYPSAWFDAPHTLPLGEAFDDFTARIGRVRNRALAAGGPVLAFGHGAWLGGLRSILSNEHGLSLSRYPARNGELLRLDLTTASD